MSRTVDTAAIIVGGFLLELAPKSIVVSDAVLENYYEPAVQEFKAAINPDFEPPHDFKQRVMDKVRYYLDTQHKRLGV